MTRGQLPKAYLRLDPNVDQQHPDNLAEFIRLLCAGARQSQRGRFSSRAILESLFGKVAARRFYDRGDVAELADGRVEIPGWDLWQEGDFTVGERMQRLRSKPSSAHRDPSQDRNSAVTEPSPNSISPSEASRRLGVKASIPSPSTNTEAGKVGTVRDGQPTWEDVDGREDCDHFRKSGAYKAWRRWKYPPSEKQLAILEPIAAAYPEQISGWIRNAPAGATYGAIEYVQKQARKAKDAPEIAREAARDAADEVQLERTYRHRAELGDAKAQAWLAARGGTA